MAYVEALSVDQRRIRRLILSTAFAANKGHIGSALSIADLLLAADQTVGGFCEADRRANLVMSKGHAASALYALMALRGHISEDDLHSYCSDGSVFGTHPSLAIPGVTFATGSLGQGIGFAVGLALADAMRNRDRRTLCIMSDAEINEGSSWEALLIAGHRKLNRLAVLVDRNGQQALGMTQSVLDTRGFGNALASLGWTIRDINGHNLDGIAQALNTLPQGSPLLLLCNTNSGSGVSFMERRVEWHYLPMTQEQYTQAMLELSESESE